MFVSKAAVVGAGTMGGEIAQAIAVVRHPRRPQGHRPEVRRPRPREGPRGDQGPARPAGLEGEAHPGAGRRAARGGHGPDRRARPPTTAFGDVDFVIEAAPEKMEIKQAVFAELDEVTPGPRDPRLQHLVAVDHRDGRRDPAAREGRRLPLLLPGVGDAAGRDHRGRGHRPARSSRPPSTSPRRSASSRSPAREVPGFVVNRILNSAVGEIWRAQEEQGLSIKKIDEGVGGANVAPMGPFFLVDLLGLDTILHVAEHLQRVLRRLASTSTRGCRSWSPTASSARRPAASGFYKDGEPQIEGDAEPDGEDARRAVRRSRRWSRPAWCSRRASAPCARSTSG